MNDQYWYKGKMGRKSGAKTTWHAWIQGLWKFNYDSSRFLPYYLLSLHDYEGFYSGSSSSFVTNTPVLSYDEAGIWRFALTGLGLGKSGRHAWHGKVVRNKSFSRTIPYR